MTISTPRLVLTPLSDEDAERLWPYVSDPEVSRFMSWHAHESLAVTKAFIADVCERTRAGTTISWVVSNRDTRETYGLVSLIAIMRTHRALTYEKAELAYWLGRPFRNCGYGTEACRAALDYAFTTLGLNKVVVAHAAENVPSQRLIERLGFRRVGVEYRHFAKDNHWFDHVLYELLQRDWLAEGGRRET
jgi:ribosomal-protein-alanine N-acetyltransferase